MLSPLSHAHEAHTQQILCQRDLSPSLVESAAQFGISNTYRRRSNSTQRTCERLFQLVSPAHRGPCSSFFLLYFQHPIPPPNVFNQLSSLPSHTSFLASPPPQHPLSLSQRREQPTCKFVACLSTNPLNSLATRASMPACCVSIIFPCAAVIMSAARTTQRTTMRGGAHDISDAAEGSIVFGCSQCTLCERDMRCERGSMAGGCRGDHQMLMYIYVYEQTRGVRAQSTARAHRLWYRQDSSGETVLV